jgi:hypothetical protein
MGRQRGGDKGDWSICVAQIGELAALIAAILRVPGLYRFGGKQAGRDPAAGLATHLRSMPGEFCRARDDRARR